MKPIELVGGYYDGAIRSVGDESQSLNFIALGQPEFVSEEASVPQVVRTVVYKYLRTERFSSNGYRIYQFDPPKAK